MPGTLEGKVALVTGAVRRNGRATIHALTADGAAVVINTRRSVDEAQQVRAEVESMGGRALVCVADVTDEASVVAMFEQIDAAFGGLDILVNNAGVAHGAPIEEFPLEEFDRLIAVNVRGVFAAVRAAVPHLGSGGRIITIGSVNADRVPVPGISIYSTTKAAVAGLTRGLARELGPRGITVNNVQPGPTATDMNPDEGDFADHMRSLTALGRYGQPADIASAVAYLALPEAGFVTGVTWNIDGGYTL